MAGHSGTAFPGMVAELIDPSILSHLARGLDPAILVVGTNGKTTTSRLIVRILTEATGVTPIANASGANMHQGVVAALLRPPRRGPRSRGRGLKPAVLEVDELSLARIADAVRPGVVVMTNLFRDQLDRYGETERVVTAWRGVLDRLPRSSCLVICGDDPRLEDLAVGSGLRTIRFGHEPSAEGVVTQSVSGTDAGADPVACRVCGAPFTFAWRTIAHLGGYQCPANHVRRAPPDIEAAVVATTDDGFGGDAIVRITASSGVAEATVGLEGPAGAYDCAAAVAAAVAVGIDPMVAIAALDGASPAFGRRERADVEGRHVILTLVKNPASLLEAARAAVRRQPDAILLALNDLPADGRDVSWIWDVDLDALGRIPVVGLTGTRADDLAVRLKYGESAAVALGVPELDPDPERALAATARRVRPDGTLVVLATYTALMAIRHGLERRGLVAPIPQ